MHVGTTGMSRLQDQNVSLDMEWLRQMYIHIDIDVCMSIYT